MKILLSTPVRAFFLCAAITGTVMSANAFAQPKPGVIWRTDGQALLELKQERPILLRFYANWCGPCRIMDANVWPDAKVAQTVNDHFIPVELDIDRPEVREIARQFKIVAVPTMVLLDRSGKELDRANFMNTDQLLKFLGKTAME